MGRGKLPLGMVARAHALSWQCLREHAVRTASGSGTGVRVGVAGLRGGAPAPG